VGKLILNKGVALLLEALSRLDVRALIVGFGEHRPQLEAAAPPRVVATKCDGCVDRVRAAGIPACVDACKVDALVFGELNELIAAGCARESSAMLTSAAATVSLAEREPDGVAGWRAWGASAAHVNEEVRHGKP
jgi:Fe-S-cluster-containing dehydrogenase component